VRDLAELEALRGTLDEHNVLTRTVVDEGHTEVAPGSVTCMSIEPQQKDYMRQFVGKLRLL
jgi:peptidyl-tRNA hydrolase